MVVKQVSLLFFLALAFLLKKKDNVHVAILGFPHKHTESKCDVSEVKHICIWCKRVKIYGLSNDKSSFCCHNLLAFNVNVNQCQKLPAVHFLVIHFFYYQHTHDSRNLHEKKSCECTFFCGFLCWQVSETSTVVICIADLKSLSNAQWI